MPKKRIENPCERCGFDVFVVDRHGDPLPQHTHERDCFRAAYAAAVEEAREEIDKHVGTYHASEA